MGGHASQWPVATQLQIEIMPKLPWHYNKNVCDK